MALASGCGRGVQGGGARGLEVLDAAWSAGLNSSRAREDGRVSEPQDCRIASPFRKVTARHQQRVLDSAPVTLDGCNARKQYERLRSCSGGRGPEMCARGILISAALCGRKRLEIATG